MHWQVENMKAKIAIAYLLLGCSVSRADVVVYKESCGYDAKENWNLTCKIDRNTLRQMTDFDNYAFEDLQSITICASFHNRGGLNSPATIVYNYRDRRQFMPTALFDTVRFKGSLMTDRMSWTGTAPRSVWPAATKLQAELARTGDDTFVYTENLSTGGRRLGAIHATCTPLKDDEAK